MELFPTFWHVIRDSQVQSLKKKTVKTHLILIVYFRYSRLFTESFSRTTTIRPVISADEHYALIVSQWMNTISSRDQFKPIRIGENVLVNYNGW